jgi:hypothetical protein
VWQFLCCEQISGIAHGDMDLGLPVRAPRGGGGNRKPQALEVHALVLADLLATVATEMAKDNPSDR